MQYGHMQSMEDHNKMIAIVDMIVPGNKSKREMMREMMREMDDLRPKGHAGTPGIE